MSLLASKSSLSFGSAVRTTTASKPLVAPRITSRGSTLRTSALLDFLKPKEKTQKKQKRETVVLQPAYNLQVCLSVDV